MGLVRKSPSNIHECKANSVSIKKNINVSNCLKWGTKRGATPSEFDKWSTILGKHLFDLIFTQLLNVATPWPHPHQAILYTDKILGGERFVVKLSSFSSGHSWDMWPKGNSMGKHLANNNTSWIWSHNLEVCSTILWPLHQWSALFDRMNLVEMWNKSHKNSYV